MRGLAMVFGAVVLIAGLFGLRSPTRATSGNASSVEWVRWDAQTRTMWWSLSSGCEACRRTLFREALSAPVTDESTRARWSELAQVRERTARVRLRRPTRGERAAIDVRATVTAWDAIRLYRGDPAIRRLKLDVAVTERGDGVPPRSGRRIITAYDGPRVRLTRLGDVPDSDLRVAVVTFVGNPVESRYDSEAVIVLRP